MPAAAMAVFVLATGTSLFLACGLGSHAGGGLSIAGLGAAGPGVGMLVDADLVQFRRVDAVEPVGHLPELKRGSVLDDRAGGEALAGETNRHEQDEYAHQGLPAVARAAPIGRLSLIGEPGFGLNPIVAFSHSGDGPARHHYAVRTEPSPGLIRFEREGAPGASSMFNRSRSVP